MITRKSELERTCTSSKTANGDFRQFSAFHQTLRSSLPLHGGNIVPVGVIMNRKTPEPTPQETILNEIMCVKKITATSPSFPTLRQFVHTFGDLRVFGALVEQYRMKPYSRDNPDHEAKLLKLWDLMMPGQLRRGGRFSDDWAAIGFQGLPPPDLSS
ncbi:hypothetical protein PAPYR_2157 [Paratrimastix pyriformis]|uniref:ELMO domain-containing protein n=1 Tax=Paratrimastix pyriformis TaxID=342808 RepID=A0ABQ8UQX8_9EUKA|nr:hypothetical protein PAPYR_2157 [Paratrimastix pyriformis]